MNKEFLKMQKLAGLITEGQYKEKLNEDNLEVKKAAKDLYTFLKKNGVVVKLDTVSPTSSKYKSVGNQDPKTNQAYIFYFDQGGQTKIHVRLTGPENDIKNIESKFFSAYPNLEQVNRMIELGWTKGIVNVDFEVKEKMTKKGGLAGNTNVNEAEEGPSVSDIVKKITQYLKSNDYNSLVFLDGKKIEGNPGDPFEIMGKSNDGNISVVGRGNKPELVKNEMEHLQKWILNNFDSLKLQSPFTPGHMGGDQHNGKFWVKIDPDKKQ